MKQLIVKTQVFLDVDTEWSTKMKLIKKKEKGEVEGEGAPPPPLLK